MRPLLVLMAAVVVASAGGASSAVAAPSATTMAAYLAGTTEVPTPVVTPATGSATVVLNDAGNMITVDVTYQNLTSAATAAHIHDAPAGVSGGIVFDLAWIGGQSGTIPQRQFAITPAQRSQLLAGNYYVNIHSSNYPNGEIRGQIGNQRLTADLNGLNERPNPVVTNGTGTGTVVLNHTQDMITVDVSYQNLTSQAVGAHVHFADRDNTGPIVFDLAWIGGPSGTIPQRQFAITPAQVPNLMSELNYINVHSNTHPSGEIRGQLVPQPQQPTSVRIRHATATRTRAGIVVRWRTASRGQTLGFNVYRQWSRKLVRLNPTLIPSVFGGTTSGHRYSWLDRSAPLGASVTYRLQAVSLSGKRSWLGSVSVS